MNDVVLKMSTIEIRKSERGVITFGEGKDLEMQRAK
jgi:hypothetical protein